MGVSQRSTGLASNHQLAASSVSWDRDRLGRRVTSEPIGFNIWAIAFRRAAELGSPSCTWQDWDRRLVVGRRRPHGRLPKKHRLSLKPPTCS